MRERFEAQAGCAIQFRFGHDDQIAFGRTEAKREDAHDRAAAGDELVPLTHSGTAGGEHTSHFVSPRF